MPSPNVPEPASAERQPDYPRITVAVSGLDYCVPDVFEGKTNVLLTIAGVTFHGSLHVLRRLIVDCDVLLERTAQQRKQAAGS